LEDRPARFYQSVELSGLDAWLEKYPDYERPERSISYYNKGELLGYLLDLAIRYHSGGRYGLDELMRRLNVNFAERHGDFSDEDLIRIASLLAPPGSWAQGFFERYVYGTQELDYATYLSYAGLQVSGKPYAAPDWGFQAARGLSGLIRVSTVNPSSGAAHAGLRDGDALMALDGQTLYALPQDVSGLKPGQRVELTVWRSCWMLEIAFRLGSRLETLYRITEMPNTVPLQIEIRKGWLEGGTVSRADASKP
ncbi:MAG: hypothetical protein ACRD10_07980, partial [Terriglobia bacterium]